VCGEVSLVCCVIFGWMSLHWSVGEGVGLCSELCEVHLFCGCMLTRVGVFCVFVCTCRVRFWCVLC